MFSPPCSPLMSRIYGEPEDSIWRVPLLAKRSSSPSDSTQPSNKEQPLTSTLISKNLHEWDSLASVKPEPSFIPNLVGLRSPSLKGSTVQLVQHMAIMDALGLQMSRKIEGTAGEHMLHRFPPGIEFTGAKEALEYDDDVGTTGSDFEGSLPEGDILKTAAEDRADKRRMKRFRLTHGQTRFLQSEFARQAHPDSAQRERLSREIPGLSPRQVQVWFQNRRAKMKRLLGDDRERMIKSRAVPEGFDTTRSLRSPYLRSRQEGGVSLKAEEDNAHSCDTTCPPEGNLIGSPSSISSNPDSFYAAASSVSTSEAMSPESSRRETPFPSDSSLSPKANSQPIKRYSRSLSFPQVYHSRSLHPSYSDLEQTCRRRAESLATPLGVEFPFAEVGWDHSSSYRSRIDRPSYPAPNSHLDQGLQNPFGVPANPDLTAAQSIFTTEMQLSQASDRWWPECQIPAAAPPPQHGILALGSDFAIYSQTRCVTGNFNILQGSGSEALQGPSPLLTAEADGTPVADLYYQRMSLAESYPAGFRDPFAQ